MCLSYRIKKRKKATTFKLIKLLKHTQKLDVTTEDTIPIRHYRLDKSIEPENKSPNNPDLNPADYSILENLSQRLYKHQWIIGYEPADLTVHPPPRMIEGGFIFFVWVSSVTKIFSSKKKWIL